MFAGIVSAVGRIARSVPAGDGVRLTVEAPGFGLGDVRIGDSIAIQGACHTVVAKSGDTFDVDTSRATLDVTAGLEAGRAVNLEKSLRLGDRVDGHLVSGHVDGVGALVSRSPLGEAQRLVFRAPRELMRFIAPKGSIAVDGTSLTVNEIEADTFSVAIIPRTQKETRMHDVGPGSPVNLEIDLVARYVQRLLEGGKV